jgi:hypothetical protein
MGPNTSEEPALSIFDIKEPSALKTQAARSSETLIFIHRTTRRGIQEGLNIYWRSGQPVTSTIKMSFW